MTKKEPLYPHVPKGKTKSTRESTTESFLSWLDSKVIADAIIENLQEQGLGVTVENMKKVWLSFLENEMPDGLQRTVKYIL